MEWVLLATRPPVAAQLLVGALESEGVTAKLERDGLSAVYGQHTFAAQVFVPAGQLTLARQVLLQMEGEDADP